MKLNLIQKCQSNSFQTVFLDQGGSTCISVRAHHPSLLFGRFSVNRNIFQICTFKMGLPDKLNKSVLSAVPWKRGLTKLRQFDEVKNVTSCPACLSWNQAITDIMVFNNQFFYLKQCSISRFFWWNEDIHFFSSSQNLFTSSYKRHNYRLYAYLSLENTHQGQQTCKISVVST